MELVRFALNSSLTAADIWQSQYILVNMVPHRGFSLLTVSSPDSSMLRCRSARIFFSKGVQIPCPMVNFSCIVSPYSYNIYICLQTARHCYESVLQLHKTWRWMEHRIHTGIHGH
jgi:hypothetical protein